MSEEGNNIGKPPQEDPPDIHKEDKSCKKLIVEIGSNGDPIFHGGTRQQQPGEYYLSINKDERAVKEERNIFGQQGSALKADGYAIPLGTETVDELIYTDVFSQPGNDVSRLLKEAARVIKPNGRIVITNTNTPTVFLDILFSDVELFRRFGLKVEKATKDEKKLLEYHHLGRFLPDGESPLFQPHSHQFILVKE